MGKIPDRWLNYTAVGQRIPGTNFIAFKTPLKRSDFTPEDLLAMVPSLKMVIDLTNTKRYYQPDFFLEKGVKYNKLTVEGGGVVPSNALCQRFNDIVEQFLKTNPDDVIGVHCTHGLNRTGFFICGYMITEMKMDARKSISLFENARGYKIEREIYTGELMRKEKANYRTKRNDNWRSAKFQQERPRRFDNSQHRYTEVTWNNGYRSREVNPDRNAEESGYRRTGMTKGQGNDSSTLSNPRREGNIPGKSMFYQNQSFGVSRGRDNRKMDGNQERKEPGPTRGLNNNPFKIQDQHSKIIDGNRAMERNGGQERPVGKPPNHTSDNINSARQSKKSKYQPNNRQKDDKNKERYSRPGYGKMDKQNKQPNYRLDNRKVDNINQGTTDSRENPFRRKEVTNGQGGFMASTRADQWTSKGSKRKSDNN